MGKTWEDAYEVAAEELKGTPAFGSPETIKKSYQQVEKDFKDLDKAHLYFLLSPRICHYYGIDSMV